MIDAVYPDEEPALSGVGASPSVASIHIYPLKAGRAVHLHESVVEPLTTAGSLAELGHWLAADGHPPVPMNRFRPNVVVEGTRPWAEDRWRRIRIGTVTFRVVKPCGRCLVTTIDQTTAERGRQPLAMLGRRRRIGQQLVFGQNMIPDTPGTIRIGDQIRILG